MKVKATMESLRSNPYSGPATSATEAFVEVRVSFRHDPKLRLV